VIGRYTIRQGTEASWVARWAEGRRAARFAQWAAWNAKKIVKAAAGPAYVWARRALLRKEIELPTTSGSDLDRARLR
jgi:aminoglycoside phosphotransferase (APT) family kinase protein